jgi:hypothetical protein
VTAPGLAKVRALVGKLDFERRQSAAGRKQRAERE